MEKFEKMLIAAAIKREDLDEAVRLVLRFREDYDEMRKFMDKIFYLCRYKIMYHRMTDSQVIEENIKKYFKIAWDTTVYLVNASDREKKYCYYSRITLLESLFESSRNFRSMPYPEIREAVNKLAVNSRLIDLAWKSVRINPKQLDFVLAVFCRIPDYPGRRLKELDKLLKFYIARGDYEEATRVSGNIGRTLDEAELETILQKMLLIGQDISHIPLDVLSSSDQRYYLEFKKKSVDVA